MSLPRVAFVIPVHNVEAYLSACLDSVLDQTIKDIEVICVDDASTDKSCDILQEYVKRDSRVRVIRHLKNQGQSVARNNGLDAVKAPWVVFIDSDDIICRQLSERCLAALAPNTDVVFYDYKMFIDGESPNLHADPKGFNEADRGELLTRKAFPWTKFIKTDFLRCNKITYPPGLLMQDIPVHWRLVLEAGGVVALRDKLVMYRQRNTSVSYRTDWKRADGFIIYDMVRDYLRSKGQLNVWLSQLLVQEINMYADIYLSLANGNRLLLPRAHSEIMKRMTIDHWNMLVLGVGIPGEKRDLMLSLCRPVYAHRSARQILPSIRHHIRCFIRSAKQLLRYLYRSLTKHR